MDNMKGSRRSRRKMKLRWHWMRSRIFKHYNERMRPSSCTLGKSNVKSLSMNGRVSSTSLPCSTFTIEKCEVVVWRKMTVNTFANLCPLDCDLFTPSDVFTSFGMAVPVTHPLQPDRFCDLGMDPGCESCPRQRILPGSIKPKFY